MGKRNPIVHIEWRSRDAERLKHFYKNAFHWKFDDSMPGYSLAETGSKNIGAGIMQLDGDSPLSPGIVGFLDSEDLPASEAAVRDAGGQIVASAQPVPGWGHFSLFTDPDGNPFGLWQSEESAEKAGKDAEKRARKEEKKAERAQKDADAARAKAEKKARKAEKKAQKHAEDAAKPDKQKKSDELKSEKKPEKKPGKKKDKKKNKKAELGRT